MTQRSSILAHLLAPLALLVQIPTGAPAQEAAFEEPPVLRAPDFMPAELLFGPHHRVDEEVRNDGFINHFTIRSNFGDFAAGLTVAGSDELGQLLVAVDQNGVLVVPAAFDYLIWQPGMEARGPLYEYAERILRLAGRISPRARRELEERGWRVNERVLAAAPTL